MFSTLTLDEPLLAALDRYGFIEMTDVQQAAIPQALEGKDLVVNARTGSGKTLSYILPLLQQVLDNPQPVAQALILAPTRELCRQINKQCRMLADFTDISSAVLIGGVDPKHQLFALKKSPDIIVATPGRLLEHVRREVIDLEAINILVIDEADRMLDLGFSDQVIKIAKRCSHECQTVLYSASFNQNKFRDLVKKILFEPVTIIIDSTRDNNPDITQQKILADNETHKLKLCHHLLQHETYEKALVFANKRENVNHISRWLQSKAINCGIMHSDITQDQRNAVLRKLRNDEIDIIIATDVASRGLDINKLDLIINFDVPNNGNDYQHRIGRTGRMYKLGMSITLVSSQEWNRMISIENFLSMNCDIRNIASLPGKYTGPEKTRSSGKAYGIKRKKLTGKKPTKTIDKKKSGRIKNRLRDRKNIGKRRKPSNPANTETILNDEC